MESFENLDMIGRGRTAEIFDLKDGRVLKLYMAWMGRAAVEREARSTAAAHEAGVPTPAVYDVVDVDGRTGIVMEKVSGQTLVQVFKSQPWKVFTIASQLADLHVWMHAASSHALPRLQEILAWKIRQAAPLPQELKDAALNALEAMPEGNAVCHGDFHPDNVMLTDKGMVIIDWIDGTCGNPLADVARTTILMTGTVPNTRGFEKLLLLAGGRLALNAYRKRYAVLNPGHEEEIERWIPVVAAGRLSEGIAEDDEQLLRMARRLIG